MDFHSVTLTPLRFQRPVSSVMLWLPSGFPFGVRRGMIGLWHMPHDTFTYYLLKVGFMPPLRAHSASQKTSSCRNRNRRLQGYFYSLHTSALSVCPTSSAAPSASAGYYSQIQRPCKALCPLHCPMKRFVKCFFELLTQTFSERRETGRKKGRISRLWTFRSRFWGWVV